MRKTSDASKKFWCWCPSLGHEEDDGAFVNAECIEDAAKYYAIRHVFLNDAEPPCGCAVFVRENSAVDSTATRYRVFGYVKVSWSERQVLEDE